MQYQLGIDLPSEYNDSVLRNLGINSNFMIKGPFDASIYADRISGLIGSKPNGSNHCHSCCHKSSSDEECSSHSKDKRMAVFEEMNCVQVDHEKSCSDSSSDSEQDCEEDCHDEDCHDEDCEEECVLKSSSDCCYELEKEENQEMRKSKKVSHRPTKVDKYLKEASSKRKQIRDIVDSVDLESNDTAVERTVSKKKQKLNTLDANFEKNMNELKKKINVMSHSSEKNE